MKWKLVDLAGNNISAGSKVVNSSGELFTVQDAVPPESPGKSGRVYVVNQNGTHANYYPRVLSLKFVPIDVEFEVVAITKEYKGFNDDIRYRTRRSPAGFVVYRASVEHGGEPLWNHGVLTQMYDKAEMRFRPQCQAQNVYFATEQEAIGIIANDMAVG